MGKKQPKNEPGWALRPGASVGYGADENNS
jgi:hypothetical protein